MARTLMLSTSLSAIIAGDHTASDIKTASVGIAATAKAVKAFAGVTDASKRPTFAAIAGAARVTESDACIVCTVGVPMSAFREALRSLRRSIVSRVLAASVVHDATDDAADVVTIDHMVSNLDIIVKHVASIVRPIHTCAAAA